MAQANKTISSGLMIPETLQEAIDPAWLGEALASVSGNSPVIEVQLAEVVKAMAAKVRIGVRFANDPETVLHYCVKGFLDTDQDRQSTGEVTTRESNFYTRIAPHLSMRVPACPSVVTDDSGQAIMIMEDVIATGGSFCDTHSPFTVEQARETLEQIALLHASSHLLESNPWIPRGLDWMAESKHFPQSWIHQQMHDGRGKGLPESTLDGGNLLAGLRVLADQSREGPQTLLHGDTHIANVYRTADGPGFADWQLIKSANWAIDVAYHINCVLPVALAEQYERELVDYYRDALDRHGGQSVDRETAWDEYCRATPYGLYLWAITTRVDPAKTKENFQRLGAAVTRSDAYRRLGVMS
ncbi:phosphotransferase [Haliea sp. E17]|uniref:phosphotransferase n=1 Tax=Haliea sp. E17 TaxID=3401576 RepID=UPI003AAF7749